VCGIKQFALSIFQHIPFLSHHVPNLQQILEEWRSYKISVPTYGTILLTPDMKNCLLVQSFFAKNSWSFPKGKVNENEDPVKCAVREVYEETGFDCGHLIDETAYVEGQTSNYQYTRLYIVKNVPMDTKFCPRTRNEIKDCSWFTVDELPTNRNDDGYFKDQRKIRANSFYMILPFISKLKHWIANERLAKVIGNKRKQKKVNNNKHQVAQQQQGSNKKTYHKTTTSPFFNNNGHGDHHYHHSNNQHHRNGNNSRPRHKSVGESLDRFSPNVTNGTFYNDHLKTQNSSTPIANGIPNGNGGPLMPSSSSAFRATNNLANSFNKKKLQQQPGKLN
jgi:mRNA-decapping enzyme subunit 2